MYHRLQLVYGIWPWGDALIPLILEAVYYIILYIYIVHSIEVDKVVLVSWGPAFLLLLHWSLAVAAFPFPSATTAQREPLPLLTAAADVGGAMSDDRGGAALPRQRGHPASARHHALPSRCHGAAATRAALCSWGWRIADARIRHAKHVRRARNPQSAEGRPLKAATSVIYHLYLFLVFGDCPAEHEARAGERREGESAGGSGSSARQERGFCDRASGATSYPRRRQQQQIRRGGSGDGLASIVPGGPGHGRPAAQSESDLCANLRHARTHADD